MTSEKADTRRRYSSATKAQVVAECAEPGASVAKIAMAHGINANVVHRWRKLARGDDAKAALKSGEFIALPLTMAHAPVPPTTSEPAVPDLQVELRHGAITMSITWPTSAAAEFALWTREVLNRQKLPDGSATAKAIDYSLKRWAALTRFIDNGDLAADNNRIENLIRPIALGRKNWLFAGSLRAGQRAAAIMSLLHTARLNGLEPYAYLKDVLERLPTQPASAMTELLPYRWSPAT